MICYECEQIGTRRDATAMCHHCSAALCSEHATVLTDPVTAKYPIVKTIVLPLRARLFLCNICKNALEQTAEGNRAKDHADAVFSEPPVLHSSRII
jgi:hypothetical protein